MRRVAISADDDEEEESTPGVLPVPGAATTAPPAVAPALDRQVETAAQRSERERELLRELGGLLLRADAHRATARQCGLIGLLCSKLGSAPIALEVARTLTSACLSARSQKECVAKGGIERLARALASDPVFASQTGGGTSSSSPSGTAPPVCHLMYFVIYSAYWTSHRRRFITTSLTPMGETRRARGYLQLRLCAKGPPLANEYYHTICR
ncbi:hypothetical protein T492DRAFT_536029 [Pavlovales sp. CCMP2436]|nr:hypothetical protein T492DRAFT_536029 [Pavlovales sp. CCMP2436]